SGAAASNEPLGQSDARQLCGSTGTTGAEAGSEEAEGTAVPDAFDASAAERAGGAGSGSGGWPTAGRGGGADAGSSATAERRPRRSPAPSPTAMIPSAMATPRVGRRAGGFGRVRPLP